MEGQGDLYLFISIDTHSIFKRAEENLFFDLPITFSNAALGTTVEVPSIDGGKSKIKIPPGAQNGKQFRIERQRYADSKKKYIRGSLYKNYNRSSCFIDKRQKELLEEFKKIEESKN